MEQSGRLGLRRLIQGLLASGHLDCDPPQLLVQTMPHQMDTWAKQQMPFTQALDTIKPESEFWKDATEQPNSSVSLPDNTKWKNHKHGSTAPLAFCHAQVYQDEIQNSTPGDSGKCSFLWSGSLGMLKWLWNMHMLGDMSPAGHLGRALCESVLR